MSGVDAGVDLRLAPARLVGVDHRLGSDVGPRLLDHRRQREAHFALDVAYRAERQFNTQKIREQLLRLPLAQAEAARTNRDHRLQPRPECRRSFGRQFRPRPCSASSAAQLMSSVLRDNRADRRHLDDLRAPRLGILSLEPRLTSTAVLWHQLNNLAHLLDRQQLSLVVLVPRLPAPCTTRRLFVPRRAPGGSDDGGFDELLEFCRNPATSAARTATRFSAISSLANAAARSCVSSTLRWSRGSVSDVTQRVDHERIALPVPSRERLPSRLYTDPCFGSRPPLLLPPTKQMRSGVRFTFYGV